MSNNDFCALSEKFFNWPEYFHIVGHKDTPGIVNVSNVEFFKCFSNLIETISVEEIKMYLKWSLIRSMAPYLSDDFVIEDFEFQGKIISGQQELKPRWKRVISFMNNTLGELQLQIIIIILLPIIIIMLLLCTLLLLSLY